MKNIQKLAEEIFQAPSQEELFERSMRNGNVLKRQTIEEWADGFPSSERKRMLYMFPLGGLYLNGWEHYEEQDRAREILNKLPRKIFYNNFSDENASYFTTKINSKNVLFTATDEILYEI